MQLIDRAKGDMFLSWVHLGDLHIKERKDENYTDTQNLIAEINQHLAGDTDFVFLPGDNADDGTEDQYRLVREATDQVHLPVFFIPGDHDKASGSLALFQKYCSKDLYCAERMGSFQLLFLNALDAPDSREFDFSQTQIDWLADNLDAARTDGLRTLVFMHLYPSELTRAGMAVSRLISDYGVEMVEMGHTHYNELANDGKTIYAATRSTGQIEEGPPGFSITVINDGVVSWRFKERGVWPFLMITSPSDFRLVTKSTQVISWNRIQVRARIWGASDSVRLEAAVGNAPAQFMEPMVDGAWGCELDASGLKDGVHRLMVRVSGRESRPADDVIWFRVQRSAPWRDIKRLPRDYENALGAWPEKGILGTQLGPNENGTKGPWPSWS